MISGTVTAQMEAVIDLHLVDEEGRLEVVPAALDTAFDGFVTLPAESIARMGRRYLGAEQLILADGTKVGFRTFEVGVRWNGQLRLVVAVKSEGGALVGMSLLHGSRLMMDVVENGPIRIEPL